MPTRNYAYARAAADIIRDMGRTSAMREYGKADAMGDLVRGIPANAAAFVQSRDARADRAEQQAIRDLQRKAAEQNLAQTTREFGNQQAISDITARTPRTADGDMDYSAVAREVAFIDPVKAAQLQSIGDAHKARGEAAAMKTAQEVARILGDATDDATWGTARAALEKKGVDVSGIPEAFDKNFRDTAITEAMTFESWLRMKTTPTKAPVTFPRGPETRVVNGVKRDVVMGSDSNWYLPGQTEKALPADTVKPVPVETKKDTPTRVITTKNPDGTETTEIVADVVGTKRTSAATPDKDKASGITPAMRQQAEARKSTRLLALEEAFRASQGAQADTSGMSPDAQAILAAFSAQSGGQKKPISQLDLDNRKLMIENAYRAEIGAPPVLSIHEAGYRPATGAPAPAAPAAATAPTPPQAAAAPAAVPAAKTQGATPILVKMPDGKTKSFTPEQFEAFKQKAAAAGFAIK